MITLYSALPDISFCKISTVVSISIPHFTPLPSHTLFIFKCDIFQTPLLLLVINKQVLKYIWTILYRTYRRHRPRYEFGSMA